MISHALGSIQSTNSKEKKMTLFSSLLSEAIGIMRSDFSTIKTVLSSLFQELGEASTSSVMHIH